METVDQFFENKDYENLLYYFDYKIFCLIIMIFMKNKLYKSKNLNENYIICRTAFSFTNVFKNI